jgi:hypothetical protein
LAYFTRHGDAIRIFQRGLAPKTNSLCSNEFCDLSDKAIRFFVSRFITQVAKSLRFPLTEKRKTAALAALPIYY